MHHGCATTYYRDPHRVDIDTVAQVLLGALHQSAGRRPGIAQARPTLCVRAARLPTS